MAVTSCSVLKGHKIVTQIKVCILN